MRAQGTPAQCYVLSDATPCVIAQITCSRAPNHKQFMLLLPPLTCKLLVTVQCVLTPCYLPCPPTRLACIRYKMKLIMPRAMTAERAASMAAYGAELIWVDNGMEEARDLAHAMQARGEGVVLDQFSNPDNPLAHLRTTGMCICGQKHGRAGMVHEGLGGLANTYYVTLQSRG